MTTLLRWRRYRDRFHDRFNSVGGYTGQGDRSISISSDTGPAPGVAERVDAPPVGTSLAVMAAGDQALQGAVAAAILIHGRPRPRRQPQRLAAAEHQWTPRLQQRKRRRPPRDDVVRRPGTIPAAGFRPRSANRPLSCSTRADELRVPPRRRDDAYPRTFHDHPGHCRRVDRLQQARHGRRCRCSTAAGRHACQRRANLGWPGSEHR